MNITIPFMILQTDVCFNHVNDINACVVEGLLAYK